MPRGPSGAAGRGCPDEPSSRKTSFAIVGEAVGERGTGDVSARNSASPLRRDRRLLQRGWIHSAYRAGSTADSDNHQPCFRGAGYRDRSGIDTAPQAQGSYVPIVQRTHAARTDLRCMGERSSFGDGHQFCSTSANAPNVNAARQRQTVLLGSFASCLAEPPPKPGSDHCRLVGTTRVRSGSK
jgi:hypothetical protein